MTHLEPNHTVEPQQIMAPLLVIPATVVDVVPMMHGGTPVVMLSLRNPVATASFPIDLAHVDQLISDLGQAKLAAGGIELAPAGMVPNRQQRRPPQ